ncbi:hypothetical protein CSPAE12_06609 [Colletotrichum incanum]|nr:hypothetical protein CSPAE12_06609 [Colletotrichum incanum]
MASSPPEIETIDLGKAMAQESNAHMENLPTEVLLQILTQISDIHSLWNLLISSPAASRVFNQYSDDIFWTSVFDSIIPSQTQDVIRFIISLRAGAFRSTPLDQLVSKIRDREAGIVLGQSTELGYSLSNMDNTAKPSLSVLRSVLAVASEVHALSRLCIDHYRASLVAATTEGRLDSAPEWLTNDQPSWVEEQRTIRAFWRVQLVLELNLAVRTSQVQSSTEGNRTLEKLDIETFYDSNTSNLKVAYHEVMTALDFLKWSEFRGSSSSGEQLVPPASLAALVPRNRDATQYEDTLTKSGCWNPR